MAKSFADEAPRMFLHVLAIVPLDAEAEIEQLSRETAPSIILPDYAARVHVKGRRRFVLHIEYEANWRARTPRRVARYGGSLAWQYRRPVTSVVLVMQPAGCPEVPPALGEYKIGGTRTTHPFQTIKLWEVDPEPILRGSNRRLLPWTVLMRSSDEQVREMAREVMARGESDVIGKLLVLGSARYGRTEMSRLTGEENMGFVEMILQESFFVKEAKAKAQEEGIAKGRVEGTSQGVVTGRVEEARKLVRAALAVKFPGLETMPELDRIDAVEPLEAVLLDHVIGGSNRESTRAAIVAASHRE